MSKLITQTIIKNEEKRFLTKWLHALKDLADKAIILDDGSTDETSKMIDAFIKMHKLDWVLMTNEESQFKEHELKIRNQLWDEVRIHAEEGDWILTLDSDEFDTGDIAKSKDFIFNLPEQIEVISLKKIETWDEDNNYRVDGLWSNYFTRLFRFKDEPFHPTPNLKGLHCPSIPIYALTSAKLLSPGFRVFHRAYEKEEWRIEKYKFMKEFANPEDKINYEHVLSCIEPPELKPFIEEVEEPEINLCILVQNKYTVQFYLDRVEDMYYDTSKIKVLFLVDKCNYNVIKEIEGFNDAIFKSVDFMPINFEADDFNFKDVYRRNKLMYKIPLEFFKTGPTIIADIEHLQKKDLIKHFLLTDKKACYYGFNGETLYFENIQDFNVPDLERYNRIQDGLLLISQKMYKYVWNCTRTPWINHN